MLLDRPDPTGAGLVNPAPGGFGHRPVRRVIGPRGARRTVPERVLPFASGDSRKRGPEPSRGFCKRASAHRRGGAPKGERACLAAFPDFGERQEEERAPRPGWFAPSRADLSAALRSPVEASIGASPPSFLGRDQGNGLLRQKLECEQKTHRENEISCRHCRA
jgi:hypothetical protein